TTPEGACGRPFPHIAPNPDESSRLGRLIPSETAPRHANPPDSVISLMDLPRTALHRLWRARHPAQSRFLADRQHQVPQESQNPLFSGVEMHFRSGGELSRNSCEWNHGTTGFVRRTDREAKAGESTTPSQRPRPGHLND
ncbi:MAG: hypothetical protein Q7J60_12890, partial [Bradyrhizobium sp.]|nr:hypothetical protein [Bradyrhizobium sp.]